MIILPFFSSGPPISDEEFKKIYGAISSILLTGFIGGCIYAVYYPDELFKGVMNYLYNGFMGMASAMLAAIFVYMVYMAIWFAYYTVRNLLSN